MTPFFGQTFGKVAPKSDPGAPIRVAVEPRHFRQNREWQCAYCNLWVSTKSPRHAHYAMSKDGIWIKTVYAREHTNAVRLIPTTTN